MTDEENDLSDLEAQLEEFKKIKTKPSKPYVCNIDYSNAFAAHLMAAAHDMWKGDFTPKDYALAMKPDSHQALIEQTHFRDTLTRIWEELDKELDRELQEKYND